MAKKRIIGNPTTTPYNPNKIAITVDSELSSTSTNPVQNKVVAEILKKKVDYDVAHYSKINSLKTGVLYKIQQPTPNMPEYFIFAVPSLMGVVQYKISNSGISIRESGTSYGGESIPWTEWEDVIFSSDIKNLEPFIIEATLTKGTDTLGAVYYSVSSSVTAEEVQTARINGQSLILKLTDDNGYSTYSPVYYWIESYGLVRWYVHYEEGLLEVAFADIIDPQGYPFWYVTYCEYASTEYTDKAVEKLEPFIIEATVSENFATITTDVTFADIDTAYKQGKEIFLRVSYIDGSILQSFLSAINNELALFIYQSGTHHYQISCEKNVGWLILAGTEFAEKGYVDRQIGDIETSLENIITKYGLGGDSV